MKLEDIVAIRAVRTAHEMHMLEQIHPMSEHEHKEVLPASDTDDGEHEKGKRDSMVNGHGHWLAGDIEEEDEEDDESEGEDSSDEDGSLADEEDGDDQKELDQQTLEVLHAALSPRPGQTYPSMSPPTVNMESLSLASPSTVATDTTYRVIGRGTAGTIYSATSQSALKIGRDDKAPWNDICLGKEVYDALTASRALLSNHFPDLTIPLVPGIQFSITRSYVSQWWFANAALFEEGDLEEEDGKFVFGLDHIPPVSGAAVEALLRAYFPDDSAHAALLDNEGHTRLIRPYLGRRRTARERHDGKETLWNFPLYLDQMLTIIGLAGVKHIAREMAIGLAVLHWGAMVDGMDVEFVLGGREGRTATQMWILDFDKASKLRLLHSDGKAGSFEKTKTCTQMVTAVTANDPYFPTPYVKGFMGYDCHGEGGCVDLDIWDAFEEAYVEAAKLLISKIGDLGKLRTGKQISEKWASTFLF